MATLLNLARSRLKYVDATDMQATSFSRRQCETNKNINAGCRPKAGSDSTARFAHVTTRFSLV